MHKIARYSAVCRQLAAGAARCLDCDSVSDRGDVAGENGGIYAVDRSAFDFARWRRLRIAASPAERQAASSCRMESDASSRASAPCTMRHPPGLRGAVFKSAGSGHLRPGFDHLSAGDGHHPGQAQHPDRRRQGGVESTAPPNIPGILCSSRSHRLSFVRHYYDGRRGGKCNQWDYKNGSRSEAERAHLLALACRMLG